MKILAITNMYPKPETPALGVFVKQQIEGLRHIGLDVDVLVVERREKGMGSYFTMEEKLRHHIRQFDPDLVHIMYGGVLAERVTRMNTDIPFVVSFCGSDLFGEHLSGSLRRIAGDCGVFASYIAAWRADGIIVKSRNLYEALPPTIDRSKVRIIPNGIDLERFRALDRMDCRKTLGWSLNKFHVLFPTTNGDPVKRFALARAAIEVANESGLNAEIHQLKGVAHEQVPVWLNASDVVLLTSLHEGSPNIVKEALGCNVPIVSVDVGDVRERINGIEGCYIALPDPCDLGVKLGLVKSMGKRIAGYGRVQELSLEHISLSIRNFYQETIESRRRIVARQKVGLKALLDCSNWLLAQRKALRTQPINY